MGYILIPKTDGLKFLGVFESEAAVDTCIACLGKATYVKRPVHNGHNGNKMYKLFAKQEDINM